MMDDQFAMDRRSLMARMAPLLGATTLPANVLAKPAAKALRFLDKAKMQLLAAVADTIVPQTDTPGALAAHVPAKFDGMLANWASPSRQEALVGALLRIDAAAVAQKGTGFARLKPAERYEVLAAHDIAALKPVPREKKASGFASLAEDTAIADPAYGKIKELIVLLYYYSEEALTSELSYDHSPGAWTSSTKVTADTRPSGGLANF